MSTCLGVSASPECTYAETTVSAEPSGRRRSASIQRPASSKYASASAMPVRTASMGNREAMATPARPLAAASASARCTSSQSSPTTSRTSFAVMSAGARTSWRVSTSTPRPANHSRMPLRCEARMPLTFTVATRSAPSSLGAPAFACTTGSPSAGSGYFPVTGSFSGRTVISRSPSR